MKLIINYLVSKSFSFKSRCCLVLDLDLNVVNLCSHFKYTEKEINYIYKHDLKTLHAFMWTFIYIMAFFYLVLTLHFHERWKHNLK